LTSNLPTKCSDTTEGVGWGRRVEEEGRVEKWSKQCMHMWINEQKKCSDTKIMSRTGILNEKESLVEIITGQ
jgi:hypothetical protein